MGLFNKIKKYAEEKSSQIFEEVKEEGRRAIEDSVVNAAESIVSKTEDILNEHIRSDTKIKCQPRVHRRAPYVKAEVYKVGKSNNQ